MFMFVVCVFPFFSHINQGILGFIDFTEATHISSLVASPEIHIEVS